MVCKCSEQKYLDGYVDALNFIDDQYGAIFSKGYEMGKQHRDPIEEPTSITKDPWEYDEGYQKGYEFGYQCAKEDNRENIKLLKDNLLVFLRNKAVENETMEELLEIFNEQLGE